MFTPEDRQFIIDQFVVFEDKIDKKIDKKIDRLDKRIDKLDMKIDSVEARLNGNMDSLEVRLNKKIEDEIEGLAQMTKAGFDEVHALIRALTAGLERLKQYVGLS